MVLFLDSHISYTQARQKVYKFISYLKEISEAIYRESTKELVEQEPKEKSESKLDTEGDYGEIDLELESELIAAIKEKEHSDQLESKINTHEIEPEKLEYILDTTIPHKKTDFSSNTIVESEKNTNPINEVDEDISKIHTKVHQPNISHVISNLEDKNNISIKNYSFNKSTYSQ